MNIKIGDRSIGLNERPYFVADIAANHDGDINRAFKLIELAKESGADAAKFQNFKAETIVSRNGFQTMGTQLSHQKNWGKSVFEVYEDASLPDEWSSRLKEKCDEFDIEYMTSPYDFASVDLADRYSNCFKIGSGDITWTDILLYVSNKGKPILLATGASTLQDVERAMQVICSVNKEVVLMQCNTNYTASASNFQHINLNVLKSYQDMYPHVVLGLSDHTLGHETVLGAIALGARVIEKHFTDDNNRNGPDHRFSIMPKDWRKMVVASNTLFDALGDGVKRIEANELETVQVQRRALYYCKKLSKGAIITANDVFPVRPIREGDIPPFAESEIVGRVLRRNVEEDTSARWEDFE